VKESAVNPMLTRKMELFVLKERKLSAFREKRLILEGISTCMVQAMPMAAEKLKN
jgi:hypothetical protein